MSNLSELGFRYRAAVLLIVVLAMIYGVASYFTLPARDQACAETIQDFVLVVLDTCYLPLKHATQKKKKH